MKNLVKQAMINRGVHGYTDKGGELKNKRKNVFEEVLDKQFSKKFQNEAT